MIKGVISIFPLTLNLVFTFFFTVVDILKFLSNLFMSIILLQHV